MAEPIAMPGVAPAAVPAPPALAPIQVVLPVQPALFEEPRPLLRRLPIEDEVYTAPEFIGSWYIPVWRMSALFLIFISFVMLTYLCAEASGRSPVWISVGASASRWEFNPFNHPDGGWTFSLHLGAPELVFHRVGSHSALFALDLATGLGVLGSFLSLWVAYAHRYRLGPEEGDAEAPNWAILYQKDGLVLESVRALECDMRHDRLSALRLKHQGTEAVYRRLINGSYTRKRYYVDVEMLAAMLSRANVDGSSEVVVIERMRSTMRTIQTTNEDRYRTVQGVSVGLDTLYAAKLILRRWLSEN